MIPGGQGGSGNKRKEAPLSNPSPLPSKEALTHERGGAEVGGG